ncbi:hypothetical protein FO519_009137 [Halicephalobus sp. NKZ332]|nr:hypothetical protein FO519_009137 [Halicephalobus sp. NKZ332]
MRFWVSSCLIVYYIKSFCNKFHENVKDASIFEDDITTITNLSSTHGISYIDRKGSFFNNFIDFNYDGRPIGPILLYSAIYYNTSKL